MLALVCPIRSIAKESPMQTRHSLFLILAAAFASTAAQAQDASSLEGFHVGVFAGHSSGSYESTTTAEIDHEPSGKDYGIQVGWLMPMDAMQWGVVADYSDTSIEGEDSITVQGFDSFSFHDVNSLATLRARLGFAVGRAVIFGTAGFAMADLDNHMIVSRAGVEVGRDGDDTSHTGWAAGFGVEYPVTDRVSVSAEYLRMDLGEDDVSLDIGGFPFNDSGDLALNTLRLGVNFRF
jgi:outer membrane immunogenic protein